VALGGPKQKAVLAALLLRHGEVVSADRLIDDVWGERVSGGTAKTLQVYVWQLRRVLEPGRLPGSPPHVLVTQSPGYVLRIDDGELDAERFEQLARSGRSALESREPDRALALLDDGLALWRGAALADFTYEAFAGPAIARLEELRLAAIEDRVDAELALGGHDHAVAELEALVARHPLRERLRRQHVLALYRSDRQADALTACREARHLLGNELGIEPSRPLQELERAILNQDLALAPRPAPSIRRGSRVAVGGTIRLPRTVTVADRGVLAFLIADIRGYTAFTQAQGDEAAAELTVRFARIAREGVEAHGGEVPELRGDEALAVFPSPRQALRAAVELQLTFADECELRPHLPLRVGIGLDAGEAVPVDGGYRGGPLNLAARLCAHATAGEVIASQSVFLLGRAVADISFEELGEVELKGMVEPVRVFRVRPDGAGLSRQAVPSDQARRGSAPSDVPAGLACAVPLIGRDRDSRRLGWAWRRARRGEGAIVLVTGGAGMGKTRLLTEGALVAAEDRALVEHIDFGLPGANLGSSTAQPQSDRVPTYLALDTFERASIADVNALERACRAEAASSTLVVVAMDTERASAEVVRAVARLVDDRRVIPLSPLALDDMRRIGALYVGGDAERIPAALLEATGGAPQRVHETVADWAHAAAAQRLDGFAVDTASGRSHLRTAEGELASSIVDLQVVRERAHVYGGVGRAAAVPPYKGLARFDVDDGEWFFGRERVVAEMVSRLTGTGLLGVVGPSGSGKSSAVRAGLVWTLTSGVLPRSEDLVVAVMRPGEHPLRALDRAIWSAVPEALREELAGKEGLLGPLSENLTGDRRILLVVDQFEELFTLCPDEDERATFVHALVESADPGARLTTVIAVRADFYGRCAAYPQLASVLAANQVLIGAMSAEEYRRAIEQPALRAGTRVEPALVDVLVSEVLGEPAALPLLSTALAELWDHRTGSTITSRALEKTGGVQGAVARLAEGAYAELTDEQRGLARAVFLRLAGPGEGRSVVKRRVPLTEFDTEHRPALAGLLDLLGRRRLITLDESSVEIIHEALLREWPRYQEWLDEDQRGRVVQAHLAIAAREWKDGGRDPSELYRGARLSAASDWASRNDAALNPSEREFLAASRAQHQAQMRRLRILLVAAVALLVVAAVAAGVALVQRGSARRAAASADAQRLGAQAVVTPPLDRALLLAREAVNLDNSPATQSDLWATLLRSPAATYVYHIPQPFTGQLALSPDGRTLAVGSDAGAVTFYDTRTHRRLASVVPPEFGPKQGVLVLAFSHDGSILAVGGNGTVALLDPRTHRPMLRPLEVPDSAGITGIAFSANDRTLAVARVSGCCGDEISRFDVRANRLLDTAYIRDLSPGNIDKLAYLPDGDLIASAWGGPAGADHQRGPGKIVILNAAHLHITRSYPTPGVTAIAVSPDGKLLGVGRDDGSVSLMPLATGRARLLGRHAPLGGVWSAAFTPDGRSLVTTSADHTTIVWDIRSGTQLDALTGQSDIVTHQAISPDGATLYTGSQDGTVVAWDLAGRGGLLRRTVPFTAAYPADIYSNPQPIPVAVSPDGRLIAFSQAHGLVRVWSLRTLRPVGPPFRGFSERDIEAIRGGAEDLAFSPDGRLLAAGGGAGSSIVVWNFATHKIVHTFTPPAKPEPHGNGLQFSPDGRTLANGDGGYGALLWNLRTGREERLYDGADHYVLSLAYGPDGTRLATVDNAYPVNHGVLWNIASHPARRIAVFPADHAFGWATSDSFSPDGRLLATGAAGVITVRDARTGKPLRSIQIPNGYNGVLAFSPDGSKLALLAHDGAEIWDIATGTQIGAALPGASPQAQNPGGPGNLRYTPNGHLVVVSPDGLATIWNVNPAAWDAAACRIAGRQLTRAEWARFVTSQPYARVCS